MLFSVAGLGMVSKLGSAAEVKRLLLSRERIAPVELGAERAIPLEVPTDFYHTGPLLRRMSHFAKLSLQSACEALRDSGLDPQGKLIGIIQGSVYGPIRSGIQAFDDLIDFGDHQLSPTHFSGSVYNTAATYLSLAFGIQGWTLSQTAGLDTLYTSLLAADRWLSSGNVDYVILGVGDESAFSFNHDPAALSAKVLSATSEGWTTFVLSRESQPRYGKFTVAYSGVLPKTRPGNYVYSLWHEQSKRDCFDEHARNHQACFPVQLRGSYPSASAFDLAVALISAQTGRFPVNDATQGDYRLVQLQPGEVVGCYSAVENNGVVYYEIKRSIFR